MEKHLALGLLTIAKREDKRCGVKVDQNLTERRWWTFIYSVSTIDEQPSLVVAFPLAALRVDVDGAQKCAREHFVSYFTVSSVPRSLFARLE